MIGRPDRPVARPPVTDELRDASTAVANALSGRFDQGTPKQKTNLVTNTLRTASKQVPRKIVAQRHPVSVLHRPS